MLRFYASTVLTFWTVSGILDTVSMENESDSSTEAPEEAGTAEPAPYRRKPAAKHTIKSLRLDIDTAEAGRHWLLLPTDIRDKDGAWKKYPVPAAMNEVSRVAAIHLRHNAASQSAHYIRKCRKSLLNRSNRYKVVEIEGRVADIDHFAHRAKNITTEARRQVKEGLAEFRAEASAALVSMNELAGKVKLAERMILDAFIKGEELNGQLVTVREVADVCGKVQSHIARLGAGAIDDTGASQAEADVFEEYAESTRKQVAARLADTDPTGDPH